MTNILYLQHASGNNETEIKVSHNYDDVFKIEASIKTAIYGTKSYLDAGKRELAEWTYHTSESQIWMTRKMLEKLRDDINAALEQPLCSRPRQVSDDENPNLEPLEPHLSDD